MSTPSGQFLLIDLYNQRDFVFQFFPPGVVTESGANWQPQDVTIGMQPLFYANRPPRALKVEQLWFDKTATGESVKPEIDKLEALLEETQMGGTPPVLLAMWGDEKFRGVLTSLRINRQFFARDGKTLRAEVAIELTATDQDQRTGRSYLEDLTRRIRL